MKNNLLHNTWRANDASYLAYFHWYQYTSQCHAVIISCCNILVADKLVKWAQLDTALSRMDGPF